MSDSRAESLRAVESELHELISRFRGKCTLSLTDLVSGHRVAISEDDSMATASVIKMYVLAALFERTGKGEVALSDRLIFEEHHRTIGSGVLSLLSAGIEMTVHDAAMLMMTISDNSASNICIEQAGGGDAVNEWCSDNGFAGTRMLGPVGDVSRGFDGRQHYVTTAADSCRFLVRLARGEIVSPEACLEMLRIMRRNQKREKLARHLPWGPLNSLPDPRNNWLAGKGGTYLDVRNDVGLMHGPGGEVAVAAFTEGGESLSGDHEGAVLLGAIGKVIWEKLVANPA